MSSYQHLNLVERAQIKALRLQNMSCRSIGELIDRSHTAVSRELRRNRQGHAQMSGYIPELAQKLAVERKSRAGQRPRLKSLAMREAVHEKLKIGWTPEQISAVISEIVPNASISHESIYQYIYKDYREGIAMLARSHRQRYPRRYSKKTRAPKIKNRVDIEKRSD